MPRKRQRVSEIPSQSPQLPLKSSNPAALPARRSYGWLIILVGFLVLAGCAGGIWVIQMLVKNLGQIPAGRTASQKVIDQFMQAGAAQNVNAAYNLFAREAQVPSERAKLEQLFGIKNRGLFAGYQKVEIDSFNIHSGLDPGRDGPAGTTAAVSGIVYYQNGRTRRFEAIVELQDGDWKIYDIDVNLLPNRDQDRQIS